MSELFAKFVAAERGTIEAALKQCLPVSGLPHAGRLNEALEYAVFPGGKRLRPALALLASKLAGASRVQALMVACAVEFLHSSSLILDDLPAMDDAALRRSRRALHLEFNEGVAVLASVALLNQSYALLADAAHSAGDGGALVREATRCIGANGMVGGQVVDLETRAEAADAEAVACRDLKTIALMRLMMTAGALACGADEAKTRALADFGQCFGHAYQICDDITDELCTTEAMGKPARQDARHLRVSAIQKLGAEAARRFAQRLVAQGIERLQEEFGAREEVALLSEAAGFVLGGAGAARSSRPAAPVHAKAIA